MPEGFRVATAYVEVLPDTDGFDEKLNADLEQEKAEAKVKATPDTEGFKEKLQAAVDRDRTEAKIRVTADTTSVERAAAQTRTVIDQIGAETARAKVDLDKGEFDAKADEAKAKLDELGSKDVRAKVSLDDAGLKEKAAADSSALSGLLPNVSLLGAAIAGLAIAAPSAGGALGALGGAGLTVGLAFSGVKQALTDATAAQNALGQTSAQVAATEFANSVAIRNAEQSIADAKRAAAQQAIQSAEAVGNAEQGLQNAIISEQFAQQALTQARRDAALQLQQLNNEEKDSKLSVEAARLALEQATINQRQINASNVTTALQRQQADLAVAQAQQALVEAQQKAANATDAANRANKAGVEGSPGVLSAKNAERLAVQGIQNAQQSLADAQRNAANSQVASNEAVRKAMQSLVDMQKQQALQAQATSAANSQAASKFARDMANMTQAGRDFVNQLLGMKTQLHDLSATAQTAFLPGVTAFLRSTQSLMPTLNTEIQKMGGILSGQFSALGNVVKSSGFRQELQAIFAQGNQLVQVLGPAIGRAAQSLLHLFSVAGPASAGLGKGLVAIADGFGNLFKALEPSAKSVGVILSTLGQAVGALGRPLGQVIGALADALAPTLAALLPGFRALVSALGQGLSAAIRGLAPLLTVAAQAIGSIATAISPLLPILGQLIGQIAKATADALKPLVPVIGTLVKALAGDLAQILPPVSGLIVGLIKALSPLFPLLGPIANMVAQVALQLGGVLAKALIELAPSLVRLVASLVDLAVKVLPPLIPVLQTQLIPAFVEMVKQVAPLTPQIVQLANELTMLVVKATPVLVPFLVWMIKQFIAVETGTMHVITWLSGLTRWLVKVATDGGKAWGDLAAATKRIFGEVWSFLKKIWGDIEQVFSDAWNWLKSTWKNTTDWVWNLWSGWLNNIKTRAKSVWDDLRSGVTTLWNDLKQLFNSGVSALGTIWQRLEGVFKTPVNYLIGSVYNNGIRRLWDDVVNAIGMKSLDLPTVPTLNSGGVVPGPGHVDADVVPAMLTPGERVLSRKQVAMLGGHGAIDALVGRSTGPSDAHHFAGGGIVGGLLGGIEKLIGGAKWLTNFMLHPAQSMESLLDKVVSTDAKGDLGKVMTGVPIALIKDLAKYIATAGATGGAMAMINLAKTQVGVTENPPGSNNQKYSAGLGRPAEAWCADFIDWLAKQTGNSGIIPQTASAPGMAQGFGSAFTSGSSGILPGDIVFYSGASNGWGGIGHVGIAITGGSTWQSVEGNYGDHVALNTRSSAQGHARPKYPVVGSGPGGSLIHASPSQAQAWAQQALMSYGWGNAGQYGALVNLWNRESGWRWDALNPSSGAYGIPQSLPADKMASAGSDWRDNAATQMRWGLGYIKGRYGSPAGAWSHEVSAGWYDQGGYLPPGLSAVMNATGKPEAVLDPRQTAALEKLADALTGMSGGGTRAAVHQENHFHGSSMASPEELAALQIHLATAIGNS